MPAPSNLQEVFVAELRDLRSANEQMQNFIGEVAQAASEPKLKTLLENSVTGITTHTETLKSILSQYGDGNDECRAMAGLIEEAKKHALHVNLSPQLRDIAIIAQYQRMSHYGLAGFGTAAAYANALGLKEENQKLKSITSDIYKADEYTTELAVQLEKLTAAATQ